MSPYHTNEWCNNKNSDDNYKDKRNKSKRRQNSRKKKKDMSGDAGSQSSTNSKVLQPDMPVTCTNIKNRKSDGVSLLKEFSATSASTVSEDVDVPEDWTERDNDNVDDENNDAIEEVIDLKVLKIEDKKIAAKLKPTCDNNFECDFSWDFWYHFSRYIKPEQVGIFAGINRTTYLITRTQGFWRRLYQRYFKPFLHHDLPDRFQPECMLRPRGLRAAVIQMLHWTYSPLLCQQSKLHSVWPDPHTLTGTCKKILKNIFPLSLL